METKRPNDEFVNWVTDNIPYSDQLSKEELDKLNYLYTDVEKKSKIARDTLNLGLNSKAGIDYANDFEKAMSISTHAQGLLYGYRNELDDIHGYSRDENNIGISK